MRTRRAAAPLPAAPLPSAPLPEDPLPRTPLPRTPLLVTVLAGLLLAGCTAPGPSAPDPAGPLPPVAVQDGRLTWAGAAGDADPTRVLDASTALRRLAAAPPEPTAEVRAALAQADASPEDARLAVAALRYRRELPATDAPAAGGVRPALDDAAVPDELRLDLALLTSDVASPPRGESCRALADHVRRGRLVDAGALAAPLPAASCAGAVDDASWARLLSGVALDASPGSAAEARYLPHLAAVVGLRPAGVAARARLVLEEVSAAGDGTAVHVPLQQVLDLTGLLGGRAADAPELVAGLEQTVAARGADSDVAELDAFGTTVLLALARRGGVGADVVEAALRDDPRAWVVRGDPPPPGATGEEVLAPLVAGPATDACAPRTVGEITRSVEETVAGAQDGALPTPVRLVVLARQVQVVQECGGVAPAVPFVRWEASLLGQAERSPADVGDVLRWAVAESSCRRDGEPTTDVVPAAAPSALDDVLTYYSRTRLADLASACTDGWWGHG